MVNKGYIQTEEHKRKRGKAISLALKGRKNPWVSKANKKRKGKWIYSRINIKCIICNKIYNIPKHLKSQKFCSRNCYYIYLKYNNPLKGKTYEELYGIDIAQLKKRNLSKKKKGIKNPKLSELNKLKIGNKNPVWQGGLSFIPYTKEFNKKFKQLIRERDNYICLKCGKQQNQQKKKLTIHHINYDKTITTLKNCCSLCTRCNSEVNFNRNHWQIFFQILLSGNYKYQYETK